MYLENAGNRQAIIDRIECRYGWSVKGQFEAILGGEPLEEQNDNALAMIINVLDLYKEFDMAEEIRGFLKSVDR